MESFQNRLNRLVDDFLHGRSTLSEFQRLYSDCYADEEADRDFTADEVQYYGDILERAEWTAPLPSPEERELGWQDENELKAWLKSVVRSDSAGH